MKIIRPMDLTGEGVVESNAPGDGYAAWVPDGRDFLDGVYLKSPTSSGDTTYFASQSSIYKVSLSTGATSEISDQGWGGNISGLSVSPDGGHIAVIREGSYVSSLYVMTLPGHQVVYQDTIRGANAGTGAATPAELTGRSVAWSPDSSALAIIRSTNSYTAFGTEVLRVVDAQLWQVISDSPNLINQVNNQYSRSHTGSLGLAGITFSEDGNAVYANLRKSSSTSEYDYALGFNSGTAAITVFGAERVASDTYRSYDMVANHERSELIIYGPSKIDVIAQSNLNSSGLSPTIQGCDFMAVSPDGLEILVTRDSVYPRHPRISAVDYSTPKGALPSVRGSTNYVAAYSDSYYVIDFSTDGYALIDRTDDTLITQTNPTVTKGDIYTYADRNYEALENNNDRPDLGAQLEVPTWLNLGAINPLRMFDAKLDSRTTAPSPLTITVTLGMITNGLALFNVSAASVQVVMDDPTDGVVYDSGEIQMLDNSAVNNWWDFFFAPYLEKADLALIDLPPYPDATLTITLSSDGGDVALGELVLGRVQNIGEAQYGTSVGIIDASTKERDVFGNFEIIERKFSKRAEFDVSVPTSSASGMQRILAQYRATPVVWVGNMGLEATIVYGFYRDFQINFSHYSLSDATITVEGL